MQARPVPARPARPRPIDKVDRREHGLRRGYHQPVPRHRPWGVFTIAALLFVVVIIVVAERGTFSLNGGSHPPSSTLVPNGATWTLHPAQFRSVRFSTSENGTVSGNFTALDSPVNVLVMNGGQYYQFLNNTSEPQSLNATDSVYIGGFFWQVRPPGVYWLVAWNDDPNHGTTVMWVTSVRWYAK